MDSRILHLSKLIRQHIDKVLFKIFSNKKELNELYSKFNNKTVLVVGNGPSLNITPLDDFKDVPSIGMNKIDLFFKKTIWRPSLITVVNGAVILQHKHQFKSSSIPIFMDVKGYYLGCISKKINYFLSKYSSDFSKNYYRGLGSGSTVTYSALQLAFILGAKNVILFGVDHSFNQNGTKYVKSKGDDLNHFDPNYFGKGAVWGLPDLEACEVVYTKAKEAFEADGRKIYDATINGKLTIFPKIPVEEAFKMCQEL